MEVRDDGKTNPLVIIQTDDVLQWIKGIVADAGYGDREIRSVQISVENPFAGGVTFHHEVPKLVVMVSSIKAAT